MQNLKEEMTMTYQTLNIILIAAICHASWNIMAKSSTHSDTLLWLQMLIANIVLTPAIFSMYSIPQWKAWPTLLASGILQVLYYMFLAKCYKIGNLSVVYPLVRGSAPVFVYLFSFLLGIEQFSLTVMIAIFLIVFGIYLVNMPKLSLQDLLAPIKTLIQDKSTRFSMLTGIMIAAYTLVDKQNVTYCEPLLVYYIISVIPCLLMAPRIIMKHEIKDELSGYGWLRAAGVSLFTFLGYYLVLFAMSKVEASYVSSIREISVVFVVIFQSILNKDKEFQPKILGAILIFCGIFGISYFA